MRQSIGSSLSNVNLRRLHHFVMDRGRDGSPKSFCLAGRRIAL
jgi:hypothetical protein